MPETFDVIIIGAGHNGLVCAAYLGMAGLKVKVVERRVRGRRRGGNRGISSRIPQFGRCLHGQPAQSESDPRSRSAAHGLKVVERRALNFLPTRRRPLSPHRRRPHQDGDREIQRQGCGELRCLSAKNSTPSPTFCATSFCSSRPIWCRAGTRAQSAKPCGSRSLASGCANSTWSASARCSTCSPNPRPIISTASSNPIRSRRS